MFLHFRNTYHTKKIMLFYCIISIMSFILGSVGVMALTIFNFWWLYVLTILLFFIFFFSLFLLVLENNNYNIKYYFDKKGFKKIYREIIIKYSIKYSANKRKIISKAKDYFYQFGEIDVKKADIEQFIFMDWLDRQSNLSGFSAYSQKYLEYFLYCLLKIMDTSTYHKEVLYDLMSLSSRNEIEKLFDECKYIKEPFKEKLLFIFDYPTMASEHFLRKLYTEIIYVIEGIIGLLALEKFENLMYNPCFYYSEDKTIAYMVEKDVDSELFNVCRMDLQNGCKELVVKGCKSEEEGLTIIKQNLNK